MAIGTVTAVNLQKDHGFVRPGGSNGASARVCAVKRSGIGYLHAGHKIGYELERGTLGKASAVTLKAPQPFRSA